MLLFRVVSANQVHQELTEDLLQGQNREELGLREQIVGVALATNGQLDHLHEVGLGHVVVRQVGAVTHQDFHSFEDAQVVVLSAA